MSIKVMTLVWDNSRHKASELLLLLALADFAHDDGGGIYPSVATLCGKVRMAERSVRYILRKLEASGELVAEGQHPTGTTRYRIDLSTIGGAKIAPAKIAPRQDDAPGGAKSGTKGGQPVAPDPLLNRQEPSGGSTPRDPAARWHSIAPKEKPLRRRP